MTFFLNKFTERVDVIVFDNVSDDLKFFTLSLTKFNNNLNVPIIVIEDRLKVDLSYYNSTNTYTVIYKPINTQLLFVSIGLCINYVYLNNKITLERGFTFDMSKEFLFKDREIINLTKMEIKLVVLLLKNINRLVDYQEISTCIWGKKNFSIFSLRNFVKSIRLKTYDTFIKNVSNKGYMIDSL